MTINDDMLHAMRKDAALQKAGFIKAGFTDPDDVIATVTRAIASHDRIVLDRCQELWTACVNGNPRLRNPLRLLVGDRITWVEDYITRDYAQRLADAATTIGIDSSPYRLCRDGGIGTLQFIPDWLPMKLEKEIQANATLASVQRMTP